MARMKHLLKTMVKSDGYRNTFMPSSYGRITATDAETINSQNSAVSEFRNARIVSPYGVSSVPVDGVSAQAIINGDNKVVVGVNDENRPRAKSGQTIIYDSKGSTMSFDGDIVIIPGDGHVTIRGAVAIEGSLTVNGKSVPCGICI